MQNIALYGVGGLGREIACLISRINASSPTWELIGFFDDAHPVGEKVSHFGYTLGGIAELNSWSTPLCLALCFGSPITLSKIRNKIINPNISFPNLIDPTFDVEDMETFSIGIGNIIKRETSVTTCVSIGNYNVLNGSIRIGHDASIGDYNVLMAGVRVSGEVSIGNQNLLGTDSFIKQQIQIGNNITLSPLSALLTRPKDGNTYIGNPAKRFSI